ncbi:MAG: hypothetical protein BWY21_02133 [Parcubacteria group bacterium ADurb.Bin216]|nr:MAG: hypothetical protein BWY21_02133 [Parcubacteria group bacterium ADurb.Bin216]
MPKEMELKIKHSLQKAHPNWGDKKLMSVMFATMNKLGELNNKKKKR